MTTATQHDARPVARQHSRTIGHEAPIPDRGRGATGKEPTPATVGRRTTREVMAVQSSAVLDGHREARSVRTQVPCREYDGELWFAERPEDVEFAKSLCGPCPMRAACLSGALDRAEPWGVWGGHLLVAGAIVARKRPRGRPRKSDVAA